MSRGAPRGRLRVGTSLPKLVILERVVSVSTGPTP